MRGRSAILTRWVSEMLGPSLTLVDQLSRFGVSHGFGITEPWLTPKRLMQRNRIGLNQKAPTRGLGFLSRLGGWSDV